MKKKLMAITLLAVSALTSVAVAQQPASQQPAKAQATECTAPACAQAVCPADACPAPGSIKGARKAPRRCPYEGLSITDAQKQKLQTLDQQRAEKRRQQMAQRRQGATRNDSVAAAARAAERRDYLNQVKAIVGPDQYVVFLENFYLSGAPRQDGRPVKQARADRKHNGRHNGPARQMRQAQTR